MPRRRVVAVLTSVALLVLMPPAGASTDRDRDGVPDAVDNCPKVKNPPGPDGTQPDWNGDGIGDACQDSDGDTLKDRYELETSKTDPGDWDTDDDELSDGQEVRTVGTDPRDPDTDDDTHLDGRDNCPTRSNPSQQDVDGNGRGDLCDVGLDEPALPEQPPVPLPDLGPLQEAALLADDLLRLATDGVAMSAVKTGTRDFSVTFRDASTGALLPLGLPTDGERYLGPPVRVVLHDPAVGGRAEAEALWRYYPLSRTLSLRIRGVTPPVVAGVRIEAPLAGEVCRDACTVVGAGFVNPSQSLLARDEGDAVVTPVQLS